MTSNGGIKKVPTMPSTIDEIPQSNIRRQQPLSLEEINDIRSFIDVAKADSGDGGTPHLEPLTGRRVMVPLTSKAYFEGVLQPPVKMVDDLSTKHSDVNNEQIIVNDGGSLVQMTRSEADDFFHKQSEQIATQMKSATNGGGSKSRSTQNIHKEAASTSETSETAEASFPFIEILETCDESGIIISSETVNMSNTMKRLEDGMKRVTDESGNEIKDGGKVGEVLAQTLKEGECDITKETVHLENGNDGDKTTRTTESNSKEPISDAAYESICSRLEELVRLEEEDAKSKKDNAKSSKRLQSHGWSKGFLNNTKKKSTQKKKDAATPISGQSASRVTHSNATAVEKSKDSERISKVSFSGDNKVKEIPRIGQSKVPPRPTNSARRPVTFDSALESDVDPFSPVTTIPFEENVFKGVVKERDTHEPVREVGEVRESAHQGEKKLSRFAQQRLQR